MVTITAILILGLSVSAYFATTVQVYAGPAEKQNPQVGCPFLKAFGSSCGGVGTDPKNSNYEGKCATGKEKSIKEDCCSSDSKDACSKEGQSNNSAKCSSSSCINGCNCKQASSDTIINAKCSNESCKCGSSCACGSSCKC